MERSNSKAGTGPSFNSLQAIQSSADTNTDMINHDNQENVVNIALNEPASGFINDEKKPQFSDAETKK